MIITTREQWGATCPDGDAPAPLPAREVWLHHSVTTAPAAHADDVAAEIQAMRLLEQIGQARFRSGVSYTFAVMPSGRVYQGHTPARRGTHTGGRNSTARAIVLIGNYDRDQPTGAQLDAVAELLREGVRRGWWTRAQLDGGHRDLKATACPGVHAYAMIPEVNRRAADPTRSAPVLAYGQRSADVAHVQGWFRAMFSYARDLPATGYYGDQTTAVVAEFQRRSKITGPDADGRTIGPRTRAAMAALGYRR